MASVVVVRAPNWLGDSVMALPALRALRGAEPRARITVVGRWASLLAGQGIADLLVDYPVGWRPRWRMSRQLAQDPPDIALLLPNSFESALAARRWGAQRRVGFVADGRGLLLTDAVALPVPRLHQVDEYRLLVSTITGVQGAREPEWRLAPSGACQDEVARLLAAAGLGPGHRLVGLHLGAAGGQAKRWPAERWPTLADTLADLGLVPVVLGPAADRPAAEALSAATRCRAISLAGADRPQILPALLSRLACLVSGDTGVAHLAAAVGVPTVTLFGPTDPLLTAPRSSRGRVVAAGAPCAPCFRRQCPIDHPCMRDIATEAVARQVQEVLAG